MIEFNGKQYETDKHNYLANLDDGSEPLALHFAELENIEMTPAHWEVVHFVQDFYREYDTSPAMRVLVKAMKKKLGEEKQTADISTDCFLKGLLSRQHALRAYPNPRSVFNRLRLDALDTTHVRAQYFWNHN